MNSNGMVKNREIPVKKILEKQEGNGIIFSIGKWTKPEDRIVKV